jgi:excisionase family DNA binding protein
VTLPIASGSRRMPAPSAHRGLLTVEDAAAYLGISNRTLRNWVSMRRIDHVKVGRLTRFHIGLPRGIGTTCSRARSGFGRNRP